jgi:hypothetical protein
LSEYRKSNDPYAEESEKKVENRVDNELPEMKRMDSKDETVK